MRTVPLTVAALRRLVALLVGVLMAGTLLAACGAAQGPGSGSSGSAVTITGTGTGAGTGTGTGSSAPTPAPVAPASPTTDLPTVTFDELPPQAATTLALIGNGGPYPYPKDGVTFQNRERILPAQKTGFYQEYTVTTPGSSDRGARRIITGRDGSRFYTDDHYASFHEVVSGSGS